MGAGAKYIEGIAERKSKKTSGFAKEVADMLDVWVSGIYHLDQDNHCISKADWSSEHFVELLLGSYAHKLSTYDFDYLTSLVVLSHDRCIRVQISPCNFRNMKILFHPRKRSDGKLGISQRMPTLEDHVALVRKGVEAIGDRK